MTTKVDWVVDTACVCGEGPLWHPDEHAVYWTDIPTGRLFRLDLRTHEHRTVYQGRPVGGFTLQSDGSLLLFRDRGNIVVWDGDTVRETIVDAIPELHDTRFNDVCADPEGRVFCGTMSSTSTKGRLYRLDCDGSLHLVLEGLGTPNGMGFTPDLRKFYFTDTHAGIWVFNYDRATGGLAGQTMFRANGADADPGRPDGLAVDEKGAIWSARWDGGCLLRFSPEGARVLQLELPARKVTSLCFAGDQLDEIYVTTAGAPRRHEEGPGAGWLFRVTGLNVRGMPRYRSRVLAGGAGGPRPGPRS